MKTLLSITLTLALLAGVAGAESAVSENRAWSNTYAVKKTAPRLEVSNIWGTVRVRTGKSGEIIVSVVEVRSAPNQALFERSLDAIKLNVQAGNDGLSMRVGDTEERWNSMNDCRGCRVDYQFDITVPADASVNVGTVMDGLVDVSGVVGTLSASNVNGSIAVENIHNCDAINSVNGKIDVEFSRSPTRNCKIETVNGDITLRVPTNTSLDVAVDLFNGDVESEFPLEPFTLPAIVEHIARDGRNLYRIQQRSGIRIGAGGPTYSVASMNGDVRIRRNQ